MTKKQRTQIIRALLLIGTVASLFFVPWKIVWFWILPLPDSVQGQLDQVVGNGYDGMIVYVDQGGKEPEFYAAGINSRENNTQADPNSLFKIASISKLYVAVATTKLVNNDSLSLDKTLADYFPELVGRIEYAESITLKMMIQHRSGIPNLTDAPDYWANPPQNNEDKLELALDQPAYFKPDQSYGYSNTNYLLLGMLIDKIVGYSHQQYIKEEVLDRLGLKNTFSSLSEVNLEDVMSGYHIGYPLDLKADEHGMIATAEDVGIFLRALNDGSVFNEGEQEIYSSIYEHEHAGWVPGYQSFAEYHEDIDAVVVLFNNTTDRKLYLWNASEVVLGRIVKILKRR